MNVLSFFARRFVAGETAAEAVAAGRRVNQRGIGAILDYLGEDVTSAPLAEAAANEYVHLLKLIKEQQLRACVSVKVSQMGLLISRDLCIRQMTRVLEAAADADTILWIDMEGSALTQRTIDVFEELRSRFSNIGLCLQAYLVRTGGDLDRLVRLRPGNRTDPVRIRLCKGAYKEPPSIALPTKPAVDGNFRMLSSKMLDQAQSGVYPAFATHDRDLIDYVKGVAREREVSPDHFEFQMLYGIKNRDLEGLAQEGYRAWVYIPYGTKWLPYFVRRLRERKENILFLLRNLFHV